MAGHVLQDHTRRWFGWVGGIALSVLVLGVFRTVVGGELLLWDDVHNIASNPHLHAFTWENVRWMFTDTQYSRRYQPLAWLNWAIDARLFGLSPRSCHVGNLLLHAANTWLVFLVIWLVVELKANRATQLPRVVTVVASLLGAALWAFHPLRVEVVAWASGRIYGQTTFFLLVATVAYLKAATPGMDAYRCARWRWLSVSALGLSLLTYPLAVTFFAVLVVLDFYLFGSPAKITNRALQVGDVSVWWGKIPFAVITLGVLGINLWARWRAAGHWEPPPTLDQFSLSSRIAQAGYIWAYSAWKPFVPLHLAPVYTTLVSFRPFDAPFVMSSIAVVLVTVLVWCKRALWPGVFSLWLTHLILLVPMLGLTEHPHYPNDRYDHLVAIPWAIALAMCLVKIWERLAWRVLAIAVSSVVVSACAVASVNQIKVWHDSETLFRYLLKEVGDDPYRADLLMRLGDWLKAQGRFREAEACLRESLQIWPDVSLAQLTMAEIMEGQGRNDEAMAGYQRALRLKPDLPRAHAQLGLIMLRDGKFSEATAHLSEAFRLFPEDVRVQEGLGNALLRSGRAGDAVDHFEKVLRATPQVFFARNGLGASLLLAGRSLEATVQLRMAIDLAPTSPIAHHNLGLAYLATRQLADARREFETALRLQPDFSLSREALDKMPKQ